MTGAKIRDDANIKSYVPDASNKSYCNVVGAYHNNQSDIGFLGDSYEMYNPIPDFLLDPVDRLMLGPFFNHFNIRSLNDLRNGDGTFLDFGSYSEVGDDKKSQGLLWKGDISSPDRGNYSFFNPVVGMPLSCKNGSCDTSADNMLFPKDDFDIGNSSFHNYGINEVVTIIGRSETAGENQPIINSISSSLEGYLDDVVTISDTIPPATKYIQHDFRVPENAFFHFIVGGATIPRDVFEAGQQLSGRYSFVIRGNNHFHQENYKDDTGLRCMVKINENE